MPIDPKQSFAAAAVEAVEAVAGMMADLSKSLEKAFRFFDHAESFGALDAANPFWDFSLEADDNNFDAGYDGSGGASLHL